MNDAIRIIEAEVPNTAPSNESGAETTPEDATIPVDVVEVIESTKVDKAVVKRQRMEAERQALDEQHDLEMAKLRAEKVKKEHEKEAKEVQRVVAQEVWRTTHKRN